MHIDTTTNVVNLIHSNTSKINLRHDTLPFIILLYVLLPKAAGQMVVQIRVSAISLSDGLQAKIKNDHYRYFKYRKYYWRKQ